MSQINDIKRGEEAERILNNPLYKDAFIRVHEGIIQAMKDAPMGDEKTHNRLVIALQLLKQVEKQMTDVMMTGKMARIQLDTGFSHKLRQVSGF